MMEKDSTGPHGRGDSILREHALACGMIRITDHIALDESELDESFIRASGPGGQNVNKLSTAVQLRFDVRRSPSLTDEGRARVGRPAGKGPAARRGAALDA